MAIINCPECKKEMSNEAKACPHCGYTKKERKKYGCGTLILVFVVGMILLSILTPGTDTTKSAPIIAGTPAAKEGKAAQAKEPKPVERATPKWTTSKSKDEMTGAVRIHAHSPAVEATQRMRFPYTGVKAWLGVGCSEGAEWAYIGFSESPNLVDSDTQDGYDSITTRTKWDEELITTTLFQTWGDRFLSFEDDELAIYRVARSSNMLLELNWHGEGKTYFKFSLAGSSAALADMRQACTKT